MSALLPQRLVWTVKMVLRTKASAHELYVHRRNPGALSTRCFLGMHFFFLSQQSSTRDKSGEECIYSSWKIKHLTSNRNHYNVCWDDESDSKLTRRNAYIIIWLGKVALVHTFLKRTCATVCAIITRMQIKYACKKLEAYCASGSSFKAKARNSKVQLNRGGCSMLL